MSLILDALKRSEQERRRDKAPDLQSIHQPLTAPPRKRSAVIGWIVLLAAVNISALGYWWWQQRAVHVDAVVQQKPLENKPLKQPIAQPTPSTTSPTTTTAPATENASTTSSEYTRITPSQAAVPVATETSGRIEEVGELPDDIRNNLPAMTFSFHVYSSNPQQRTIIINNRRMREGEEVGTGLLLQEITEDGVVLLYAQHRIHISVLSGW